MTLSLYSAIVPNCIQTLGAVAGLLDKALAAVEALSPDEINGFVGQDMRLEDRALHR